MFLNDKKIDKKIITDNILFENVKYVYLSGSIMEGFGNETSDIDVYVVVDGSLEVKESEKFKGRSIINEDDHVINNFIHQGLRFDYEYITCKKWFQIIKKVEKLEIGNTGSAKLSSDEYDLLHRLKYANPILNKANFLKIQDSIDFQKLDLYIASVKSETYSNLLEDVEGALLSKDIKTAFIMTRLLIDETLNAFLAAFGETNPKNKWIFKKLSNYARNFNERDLVNTYMNLLIHPRDIKSDKDLISYIKEGIRFSQKLNMRTQNEILKQGSRS
ncbi:nucleotidyltransferase domain-containing protein [Bacillus inaquosorum]|uniref:nucleotidyltransferase domain-containing protein n=1 Tax=Bacillus inaquosorum TaxID=483913 RepID=UPI003D0077CD